MQFFIKIKFAKINQNIKKRKVSKFIRRLNRSPSIYLHCYHYMINFFLKCFDFFDIFEACHSLAEERRNHFAFYRKESQQALRRTHCSFRGYAVLHSINKPSLTCIITSVLCFVELILCQKDHGVPKHCQLLPEQRSQPVHKRLQVGST